MLPRPTKSLLALLFLVPGTIASASDARRWHSRPPLAVARQEVAAVRLDGRAWVVGGLSSQGLGIQALRSVEVYDPLSNAWSFAPPMPGRRDHMAVAAHDGRLYVFGGFVADFTARANTWVFAPTTGQWTTLAPMPEGRGEAWAVAHGERIFVFGGADPAGVARDTTLIYHPGTNTWTQGAPMPTARLHLVAVAHGDYIYCIGGRDQSLVIANPHAVNERYDPANDQWSTMAPMPTARSAMGMASFRGRIHVAGGEAPILHDAHEVYDPATDTWEVLASMPVPRHAMGAVALEDEILFAGGATSTGLGETDHVDAFGFGGARRFPGPLADAGRLVLSVRLGLESLLRQLAVF